MSPHVNTFVTPPDADCKVTFTPKFHQMHVQCVFAPPNVSTLVNVRAFTGCGRTAFLLHRSLVIQNPMQQIHEASIFAECLSTTQQFNTEQIEQARKLRHRYNIKKSGKFQNKTLLVDARSY